MKVLLVCSGGMSSAISVNALKKEAEKEEIQMEVKACGTPEFEDLVGDGWDIIMVAPQVRHQFNGIEKLGTENNIPVVQIEPRAYSPMGGPKLLQQVKDTINI